MKSEDQTMHDATCPTVKVSRRIHASAAEIFGVLTDPGMHPSIDGSAMLQGAETEEVVTGIGDVFVMNIHFHALGDYQMDNHVVEFEPDRRISWEPAAGVGHPEVGTGVGHRWGFRLSPDGPDDTIVTEIYDCSKAPLDFRRQMNDGRMWIESMEETLKRLDEVVSRR
jgi:uncharacterized protein YndB with AHSA1/START domain